MAFKDHFSRQAGAYAAGRPEYPEALFEWLAAQCRRHSLAWEAGCGSGQATLALARRFRHVEASDPSERQLAAAPADPRVRYHAAAERLPALGDASVDLVAVAQAWHWFDHDAFADETARVAAPGAVFAAWTYDLPCIGAEIDAQVRALYAELGPWWPPERRHVEDRYANLPLPGVRLAAPDLSMGAEWRLSRLLQYLRSWSATAACRATTGSDPVASHETALGQAWGDPERPRPVTWPLTVRACRLPG